MVAKRVVWHFWISDCTGIYVFDFGNLSNLWSFGFGLYWYLCFQFYDLRISKACSGIYVSFRNFGLRTVLKIVGLFWLVLFTCQIWGFL